MRYGIISDIHSNLEALQAVLQACQQQRVQGILCLGDIVGYGASPKECLSILQKAKAVSVAGNHDWAVSGKLDDSYFPEDGREAARWTKNNLTFEDFTFFNDLKLVYQNQELAMVHATLHHPERFTYLTNTEKAQPAFELLNEAVCFIGHTHIPQVYIKREEDIINSEIPEFEINKGCKYIVNVGSVGQPRDGNPMASYGIFDSDAGIIELKRAAYDIETAQRKIIEAGLPGSLAERLAIGR